MRASNKLRPEKKELTTALCVFATTAIKLIKMLLLLVRLSEYKEHKLIQYLVFCSRVAHPHTE